MESKKVSWSWTSHSRKGKDDARASLIAVRRFGSSHPKAVVGSVMSGKAGESGDGGHMQLLVWWRNITQYLYIEAHLEERASRGKLDALSSR